MSSIYYRTVMRTIRLEAVWQVFIDPARSANTVVKKLLKELDTLQRSGYVSAWAGKTGYALELTHIEMVEALDKPDQPFYPDW